MTDDPAPRHGSTGRPASGRRADAHSALPGFRGVVCEVHTRVSTNARLPPWIGRDSLLATGANASHRSAPVRPVLGSANSRSGSCKQVSGHGGVDTGTAGIGVNQQLRRRRQDPALRSSRVCHPRQRRHFSCAESEHAPARRAWKIAANDLAGAEVCAKITDAQDELRRSRLGRSGSTARLPQIVQLGSQFSDLAGYRLPRRNKRCRLGRLSLIVGGLSGLSVLPDKGFEGREILLGVRDFASAALSGLWLPP